MSSIQEARELGLLLAELRSLSVETAERRRVVVRELLAGGMTMRELGAALGVSATVVHKMAHMGGEPASRER